MQIVLNYLEYTAFIFGVFYVFLAAKGNSWCWFMGIISSVIYIYLNFHWQLYYDACLQTFYVGAGFYGWVQWSQKPSEGKIAITTMPFSEQYSFVAIGMILSIALGTLTYVHIKSYFTFLDAAITVFSLIATYLTARKILENWIWWIAIDAVAIVLYLVKEAQPTAVLYAIYTAAAVYGFYTWKKQTALK